MWGGVRGGGVFFDVRGGEPGSGGDPKKLPSFATRQIFAGLAPLPSKQHTLPRQAITIAAYVEKAISIATKRSTSLQEKI